MAGGSHKKWRDLNPSGICQKWVISSSENGFLAKSVNLSETFSFLSAEVNFLGYLVRLTLKLLQGKMIPLLILSYRVKK